VEQAGGYAQVIETLFKAQPSIIPQEKQGEVLDIIRDPKISDKVKKELLKVVQAETPNKTVITTAMAALPQIQDLVEAIMGGRRARVNNGGQEEKTAKAGK
jgi:hypothetical protein